MHSTITTKEKWAIFIKRKKWLVITGLCLLVSLSNAEVFEFISGCTCCYNVQEITKLLLLQVLLGQILQVSLGERKLSGNVDLGFIARDCHLGSKLSSFSIDLNAIMQELLKSSSIKHFVIHWLPAINCELRHSFLHRFFVCFL